MGFSWSQRSRYKRYRVYNNLSFNTKFKLYFVPESKYHPLSHDRVVCVDGRAVEQERDAFDVADLMLFGSVSTCHVDSCSVDHY